MRALNIKLSNIKRYTKSIYNLYKHNLNNNLYNNMKNIIAKTVYIKLKLSKKGTLITQLYMLQKNYILQLLKNFEQVNNKRDENFSFLAKEKSFPKLILSIVFIYHFAINTISIGNIK